MVKSTDIVSFWPPVIIYYGHSNTYCIHAQGFMEKCSKETKLEDVLKRWKKPEQKGIRRFQVPSSNKKDHYIVEKDDDYYNCSCYGYKYYKKCKHIEKVKHFLNNKK
jgi:hypothetical protein